MEHEPSYECSDEVAIFTLCPNVVLAELHPTISGNIGGGSSTSSTNSLDLPSFEKTYQPVVSGLERYWVGSSACKTSILILI